MLIRVITCCVVLDNPHEKGHQNLFLNNDKSLPFQYVIIRPVKAILPKKKKKEGKIHPYIHTRMYKLIHQTPLVSANPIKAHEKQRKIHQPRFNNLCKFITNEK